jgi:hypothetical protein
LDPWVYGGARFKEELVKVEEVEVAEAEQRQMLHYEGDKTGEESLSEIINSLCIN